MPLPKGRGKVIRYRTVRVPGGFKRCEIMEEEGPRGGKVICGPTRKRKKK